MKKLISILGLVAAMALSSNAQTVSRKPTLPVQVTVLWDASTTLNVTSYNVYIGTASGSYTRVQSVSATAPLVSTFTGLTHGTTYFFTCTSVDTDGVESEYSNEVVWKANSLPAPPCPAHHTQLKRHPAVGYPGDARRGLRNRCHPRPCSLE
jgi:fibronectin type 3 domain-containing protein